MQVMSTVATIVAGLSLLSGVIAAPTPLYESETSLLQVRDNDKASCDSLCMRRLLYQTAYSSGAAGIGQVMDAYHSEKWCLSEDNKDWCPQAINSTVSSIATSVMNGTVIPPEVDNAQFVQQLDTVGRQAAVDAMLWATQTVNGTKKWDEAKSWLHPFRNHKIVERMWWTIYHLQENATSTVDANALQTAMAAYQPPPKASGDDGDRDKDKKVPIIVSTTVPGTVFGGFLLAGAACKDPILCIPGSKEWVSKLLSSSTESKALSDSSWLRYLVDAGKAGKASAVKPFSDWATLKGNSEMNSRTQIPPKDFDPLSDRIDAKPMPDFVRDVPTDLWQSEIYDAETGAMRQITLKDAPDMADQWYGTETRGQAMKDLGYKPYRMLDDDGFPIRYPLDSNFPGKERVFWNDPSQLKPIYDEATMPESWKVVGEEGEQLFMSGGLDGLPKVPALDSMGNPIMAVQAAEAGVAPELMTLQPVAAVGAEAARIGPGNVAYDVLKTGSLLKKTGINDLRLFFDRANPAHAKLTSEDSWVTEGSGSTEDSWKTDSESDDPGSDGPNPTHAPPNTGKPSVASTAHGPSATANGPSATKEGPSATKKGPSVVSVSVTPTRPYHPPSTVYKTITPTPLHPATHGPKAWTTVKVTTTPPAPVTTSETPPPPPPPSLTPVQLAPMPCVCTDRWQLDHMDLQHPPACADCFDGDCPLKDSHLWDIPDQCIFFC